MKLIKSRQRSSLKEDVLSDCLMINLEGESILNFNPDEAINYWFDVIAWRPGGSHAKENIETKEGLVFEEASSLEELGGVNVPIVEAEEVEENSGNVAYELVEEADDDSDYKSDFDSEGEETDDVFDKISKYWRDQ